MNDSKKAMERLDSLLADLEDDVLRSEPEKDVSSERMAEMRSEIETLIQANVERMEDPRRGESTGVLAPAGRTIEMMIRAFEKLENWTGASPRVRMAFSGERPKRSRKSKGGGADRVHRVQDDERS